MYQDIIEAINANGGVACRELAAQYFQVNPADTASLQQACSSAVQAKVFFAIAPNVYDQYPDQADCLAQHQVPVMADLLSMQQQSAYYPYLFGEGVAEEIYRNSVFALAQRGVFTAAQGFSKLGLVYRDCISGLASEIEGWLHQVGVSSIDAFDLGCPSGSATPTAVQDAEIQFQGQGVTNVMFASAPQDFMFFTLDAANRNGKFIYDLPDDGVVALASAGQYPFRNADGAIAITPNRFGEEDTAGLGPSRATSVCNSIFSAHGQPPVYQQPQGAGGVYCDALAMFITAVNFSPQLARSSLAAGLHAAKSVDFSYPLGPNSFTGSQATTGDSYWRVDQYHASCNCWQVADPTFHPAFS
jgi:hypothetical protein